MAIDLKIFRKAKFNDRLEEILLPELAGFSDGEPVWKVRGLNGTEWAKVQDSGDMNKTLAAVAEGFAAGGQKETADVIKHLLGGGTDQPTPDQVLRYSILVFGSVEPKVERVDAIKLAQNYPAEFYQLTNAIVRLTGLGREPGKRPGSGATPESEPPSPSVTSGADSSTSADPTSFPPVS
jgi:hypothetical protein